MTLTEILTRLSSTQIVIPSLEQVKTGAHQLSNMTLARNALYALEEIPPLRSLVTQVIKHAYARTVGDTVTVDPSQAQQFLTALRELDAIARAVTSVLESVVPDANEECIRVRLPLSADYRGVVSDQGKLLKAIEQLLLINPNHTASITIKGWETGSLWMNLGVGSASAVVVIGAAVWAAAVIRKKWHEGTILEQAARGLQVKNETLTDISAQLKIAAEAIVTVEATAIYENYFKNENPNDDLERIKETLRTFADLIDRGAEVHPALMQPEQAANLFPNFKALDTIVSAIKQLGDGEAPVPSPAGEAE